MQAGDQALLAALPVGDMNDLISASDLRDLGLAPSREASLTGPEGSGSAMMPFDPAAVGRQPSLGTLISSLQPAAPESSVPMDSNPNSFERLKLVIQSHSVHKVENENTEDREYVVSNLRTFNIEVVLVDEGNALATNVNVGLQTTLLYENGLVVQRPSDQEQILTGETEVVIIGGRGMFKLKMGPSILSSKMGKQRFRVKIEPKNERIRREYPQLTVLTEPLKSVTKLERKPPPPRSSMGIGGGESSAAGAGPPASIPPAICPATYPPSMLAGGAAPPGFGGAAAPPQSALGQTAAGFGGFAPALPPAEPPDSARLRTELASERVERSAMEDKLSMQREQIAELTRSNQLILEELSRLRNQVYPQERASAPSGDAKRHTK